MIMASDHFSCHLETVAYPFIKKGYSTRDESRVMNVCLQLRDQKWKSLEPLPLLVGQRADSRKHALSWFCFNVAKLFDVFLSFPNWSCLLKQCAHQRERPQGKPVLVSAWRHVTPRFRCHPEKPCKKPLWRFYRLIFPQHTSLLFYLKASVSKKEHWLLLVKYFSDCYCQ